MSTRTVPGYAEGWTVPGFTERRELDQRNAYRSGLRLRCRDRHGHPAGRGHPVGYGALQPFHRQPSRRRLSPHPFGMLDLVSIVTCCVLKAGPGLQVRVLSG